MREENNRSQAIQSLAKMLEDLDVAMLTTVSADGSISSRPMARAKVEPFAGHLWFFTDASTTKANDVDENGTVNLTFSDPVNRRYVSLTGSAELIDDRHTIVSLWQEAFAEWIPGGLSHPTLALLKVDVERAEYWHPPTTAMRVLGGVVNRLLAGRDAPDDEHGAVEWLDTAERPSRV